MVRSGAMLTAAVLLAAVPPARAFPADAPTRRTAPSSGPFAPRIVPLTATPLRVRMHLEVQAVLYDRAWSFSTATVSGRRLLGGGASTWYSTRDPAPPVVPFSAAAYQRAPMVDSLGSPNASALSYHEALESLPLRSPDAPTWDRKTAAALEAQARVMVAPVRLFGTFRFRPLETLVEGEWSLSGFATGETASRSEVSVGAGLDWPLGPVTAGLTLQLTRPASAVVRHENRDYSFVVYDYGLALLMRDHGRVMPVLSARPTLRLQLSEAVRLFSELVLGWDGNVALVAEPKQLGPPGVLRLSFLVAADVRF